MTELSELREEIEKLRNDLKRSIGVNRIRVAVHESGGLDFEIVSSELSFKETKNEFKELMETSFNLQVGRIADDSIGYE